MFASSAILYCAPTDIASHRLRFLIAEKQIPCEVEIIRGQFPQLLEDVNPNRAMPFFIDKFLAIDVDWIIEEYFHERHPDPALLPLEPKLKAQVRTVSREISSWAGYSVTELQSYLHELTLIQGVSEWLLGDTMTMADIAAGPLLWRARARDVPFTNGMARYSERLFRRRSFRTSLTEEEKSMYDMPEAA